MNLKNRILLSFATACIAAGAVAEDHGSVEERRAADPRPNIIFVFTDDQDSEMNSLEYMNGVQEHLRNKGATYENHFCTIALCCPSRVNLWTGRAAHNTNVTDLAPPYGGYPKFIQGGFNDDWLPVWMQETGYQTYYVGKLMNSYDPENYNKPFVNGFNGSDILCGPATYDYYYPLYQRNKEPPHQYNNQYTIDLLWNKSLGFLDDARKSSQPFFLTMATVAPHKGTGKRPEGISAPGPAPELKYMDLFKDAQVPRTENFNPDRVSGASWLLQLDRLNETSVKKGDEFYRNRLRALQSVDKVVNDTVAYLEKHKLLDNTYIIYSSDNGFHIGQHRFFPGKRCGYEEDIHVPLIIRGPGIKAGSTVNVSTTHTDIASTILHMAQAKPRRYLDGAVVPLVDADAKLDSQSFEHAQIEHWGPGGAGTKGDDEYPEAPGFVNNTYKALRIIGPGYNWQYTVWCSNEHELYDMNADAQQMHNLYTPYTYDATRPKDSGKGKWPIDRLESRLDALLLVLKSCKARTCTHPWSALHPDGDVTSLPDAMNPVYDEFYQKEQNRVSFDWCSPGYILAAEGPQTYYQYMHRVTRRLVGQ